MIFPVYFLGILTMISARKYFNGYSVYRMQPTTEEQKQLLRNLEKNHDLDFWAGVANVNKPVDVMVKPENQEQFVKRMTEAGINATVYIQDVNKLIVKNSKTARLAFDGKMRWTDYYPLDDIYSWLDILEANHPGVVSVQIGGSTSEGCQIKGVKISFGDRENAVFVEGGIHAREWISTATVTYIINELLTSTDPTFRRIAESFDWYLFPVFNPDGYVYTHTTNRFWRKTRTFISDSCDLGVDANRNWASHWMEKGASSDCKSDIFAGDSAFFDETTKTMSEYTKKIGPNLIAYIDFHSYSQLLMIPYGHTTDHLDNYDQVIAIAKKAAEALALRYGTRNEVGNIAETIYPASGGSIDWVKQEFKTPLVFVYELRDTGADGFVLPTNQIIPNNLEVMDSIVAIFTEADKMGIVTLV